MKFCIVPKSISEICNMLNLNSKSYVREKVLRPLIEKGYIDITNKNSRNAKNQKYITKSEGGK